jgi:hypothetical protein
MQWKTIEAEGCEWEVRVIAGEADAADGEDILEFVPLGAPRPVRRLAVPADALAGMDENALRSAHRQALPIGGDHYGRAGTPMKDPGG